jgi:hypothetical protein
VGARFCVMKARQNDRYEKFSKIFLMRFFDVSRRSSRVARAKPHAGKKSRKQRAPATRDAKKPIFPDENACDASRAVR